MNKPKRRIVHGKARDLSSSLDIEYCEIAIADLKRITDRCNEAFRENAAWRAIAERGGSVIFDKNADGKYRISTSHSAYCPLRDTPQACAIALVYDLGWLDAIGQEDEEAEESDDHDRWLLRAELDDKF